ncbi:hypothetical protein EIB71_00110 [Kaistella daneshvariae]|uniref:Uncharacterized protein n=1 Tax=Kaistella daneshvariae TaxID=2487074 RepID=A0ABM7C5E7_9FLAO|nr:hypothetical protein [Kaistella daneshvariae]AZI66177.1 hypothetical protein EIB71_00110 [Kaistella daneshvariae]
MKTSYTISFLTIFAIFSCNKSEINFGSNFIVDNRLNENEVFKKLNDSSEIILRKRDSISSKRSTDIKLEININDTITNISKLKARSAFINTYTFGKEELKAEKSDTLAIEIDNFDGYSSEGIKILVYKDRFDVKYYMTSDIIAPINPIELTKVNSSKLILNKNNYKVNDSIYGYLEADLTYQNIFSLQQKIKAKGYFRTIFKENKY